MPAAFSKVLKVIKENSSIIKKTFVSEFNDFLPLMCSFGYFGKTKEVKNINLISPKNSQSFFIEKYVIRNEARFSTETHKQNRVNNRR